MGVVATTPCTVRVRTSWQTSENLYGFTVQKLMELLAYTDSPKVIKCIELDRNSTHLFKINFEQRFYNYSPSDFGDNAISELKMMNKKS